MNTDKPIENDKDNLYFEFPFLVGQMLGILSEDNIKKLSKWGHDKGELAELKFAIKNVANKFYRDR